MLAQQQKAAANRSPAGSQAVSAGVSGAAASFKPPQQHMAQMAGHASGMMYRPVASAAPVQQPAQVNGTAKPGHAVSFSYYQQLLAFADQRWKETNQTQKRHEARNLVGKVKQACQLSYLSIRARHLWPSSLPKAFSTVPLDLQPFNACQTLQCEHVLLAMPSTGTASGLAFAVLPWECRSS